MQMPEIRQDRVASLKSAIEKGNYALDPDQIAEAMLNEMAG
jgi:flagellar biosynthesis anti-sigma factor FlgM